MSTIIATENLAEEMESWGLHHATYWSSDLNSWGSVSDWDVYFIDKTPGCTKDEAHRSLSLELNILLKKLSDRSRQYSKANALKKALENSDNDSANILLWNKHLKELESIAISDRVHRYYYTRRNWTSRRADIREIKKNIKASTKECEISSSSSSSKNDENYNKQEDDDAIINGMLQVNVCATSSLPMHIFSDLGNDFREASESMVGKANDEPPKTPEHRIYQKQGDYSKPFASCEEQSHGFHSSEINLGDSIESNDHDSDEDEFGLKDMNLFKQRFEALDSSRKWKLRSERFVEDEKLLIFAFILVHSFIIDTEDTFIKDEKKEEQSIPEIDEEILEYIDTFAKLPVQKSTKEIRDALNTPHPLLGRNYDPHTNFIYDHIRTTVTDWVRILEMEPNPLTMDMPEAWHRVNVWRTIDIMFSDTPYVYVVGQVKKPGWPAQNGKTDTEP
ncbi:5769_t:CDS:10 [Funneliformis mosseae]|uniref:5769_t:CDS:1 n=1 Tax=Funneliformis mosseae TaxID=27381 RepID=A0A9N9BHN3_FUNMO|nr:5769_t:CDS:10 [Funneliformis mosseae]